MKIFVMDDEGKMRHMYRIPDCYSIWTIGKLEQMKLTLEGAGCELGEIKN